VVVVFGLLPLSLTGATSVAATSSSGAVVDRVVRDSRIAEASGLAASLRHPGVLWMHNDSGHPARLFAVGPDGRTVATVRVRGVPAVDWEAMAVFRNRDGRPTIAIADIGDNAAARASVSVVVLPEPALRDATVRPEQAIRLRYPTGSVDAETLLVDPDGRRAFIVTKGFGSTVYEVPSAAWTALSGRPSLRGVRFGTATLVKRVGVPLMFVTDGVMGPGGHPLLRTYRELAVLPPIDDSVAGGSVQPLAVTRLPAQQQGEGLALRDGRTALVGSEGVGQPVLRVPFPDDAVAALGSHPVSGTVEPSSGVSRPGAAQAGSRTATGRSPGRLFPVLGCAAGVVAGCILAVLTVLARRRPRPSAR
jgi:hypothetical protein